MKKPDKPIIHEMKVKKADIDSYTNSMNLVWRDRVIALKMLGYFIEMLEYNRLSKITPEINEEPAYYRSRYQKNGEV